MSASAAKRQLQRFKQYLLFKQKLLNMMSQKDPLAILQSGIFQQYQHRNFNLINRKSISSKHKYANGDRYMYQFQSTIKSYDIDGVMVNVVEKRSHSCQSYLNKDNKYQQKIKKMEEQHNVDLVIWSNIMHNHFRINQPTKDIPQTKKDKKQQMTQNLKNSNYQNIEKQNCSRSMNVQNGKNTQNVDMKKKGSDKVSQVYTAKQDISINSPKSQCMNSSRFSNNPEQPTIPASMQLVFQQLANKIIAKPTKSNLKNAFREIFYFAEQENSKMIKITNQLRKQNQKLHRVQQQNSTKQLQYIVQVKQMQKRIQQLEQQLRKIDMKNRQKEQQMRSRQLNLNKTLLVKNRQLQHLQNQKTRKSYIQELKQKLAIDSIRRTTLCSLNKQKFDLELKKEQLGLPFKYLNRSFENALDQASAIEYTEETRCDD